MPGDMSKDILKNLEPALEIFAKLEIGCSMLGKN